MNPFKMLGNRLPLEADSMLAVTLMVIGLALLLIAMILDEAAP